MSIPYPPGVVLPGIPQGAWGYRQHFERTDVRETDDGLFQAVTVYYVDAPDGPTAELRVLANVERRYREDVTGAEFTAVRQIGPGRWEVTGVFPPQ